MSSFRAMIDKLCLKEVSANDKKFMRSNDREDVTVCKFENNNYSMTCESNPPSWWICPDSGFSCLKYANCKCIQDNFICRQDIVHEIHWSNTHAVLHKLGIKKSDGIFGWSYILELLLALGYLPRWIEWLTMHKSSLSYMTLFLHNRRLRQEDL